MKRDIARTKKRKQLLKKHVTLPNTRARQEKIMEAKKNAGELYQATNGGAPLNCDDAIIVLEKQHLRRENDRLIKYGISVFQY